MEKIQQIQLIEETGIIAIVRFDKPDELVQVARAISDGGVKVIEFTMTTPGALRVLETATSEFGGQVLLGAGTVLDPETARAAILAGAEFIVAPTLNYSVIELCHRYSKVCIPGAYTPTEILSAWQSGADFVKVFPAEALGPQFIKAVRAPLPQVKMIPVGGITLETIPAYIQAGVTAVAVGSNLAPKKMVAERRFDEIRELAKQYVEVIKKARL
jgi:2-dehydro-3-deoxyphosphogluconate aldolase / (4S)-4-hydroxy-2-oxoglutarate aldolase